MEKYDEFSRFLDELIAKNTSDEDDESSVELEITATKKKNKPASLNQLFGELIDEYKKSAFLRDYSDASSEANVSDSFCKVLMSAKDYIHVSDKKGERFILIPNRDGDRFEIGSEYHFFTTDYNKYDFLVTDCSEFEYNLFSPHFVGMDVNEKCAFITKARKDPEGFALWGNLGAVKRPTAIFPGSRNTIYSDRAEEFLCRIPLNRSDLYDSLSSSLDRYRHSPSNEKADREEVLLKKMKVISMMLSSDDCNEPLSIESLTHALGQVKVSACDRMKDHTADWRPNILIVGKAYGEAISKICETGRTLNEISLGGVEGNDFLFGDEMSYYCSGCGELVSSITNAETYPSIVLFSDIDLMGTTVRSSNPLYGLAALLRRHTFRDFYMRGLTIDVNRIQFICQINRLEDCPELLLREMDIIVEL